MRRTSRPIATLGALVVACVVIGISPRVAWAWGCEGHAIVARIAEWHLDPNAFKKAADLLTQNKINPSLKRFCRRNAADPFVDGSTWADDVRDERPATAEWHFLDIPRGADQNAGVSFCSPTGCVTKAIAEQLTTLRSSPDGAKKAEALRYVVHFVGDVHQPLHCVTNGDRGGNCVPVKYLGSAPQLSDSTTGKYTPNLHQVWDSRIIEQELARRHLTVGELASAINCRFAAQIDAWMKEAPDPESWAWAGHQKAEDVAYGKLSAPVPIQPAVKLASCKSGTVSKHMLDLHLAIDQPYQDAAFAVIEEQLAMAGARLALELNGVWP